jgi:hypothetical protein
VKLDAGLLKELKILAAKREVTLGELIEEAMRDCLEKAQQESK